MTHAHHRHLARAVLAATLLAGSATWAAAPDDPAAEDPAAGESAPPTASGAEASAEPTAPGPAWPDPRGTYRLDLSLTTIAQVPIIGKTVIETNSIYTVTIEGTHAEPIQVQRICYLNPNASRSIAQTQIPDQFIENMPIKRFRLYFEPQGDGFRVRGDMKPLAIGFDLKTAAGEIPKKADHPAIRDHENDGHPGATVHLKAPLFGQVEVYMIQHARTVIDGTWDGGPVLQGQATVNDFAQRTVGASNRLFIANPKITTVPESSRFKLTRVPSGTTCQQLIDGVGS